MHDQGIAWAERCCKRRETQGDKNAIRSGLQVLNLTAAVIMTAILSVNPAFAETAPSPADVQFESVFGVPPWPAATLSEFLNIPPPLYAATLYNPQIRCTINASDVGSAENLGMSLDQCVDDYVSTTFSFRSDLGFDSDGTLPPATYGYPSFNGNIAAWLCSPVYNSNEKYWSLCTLVVAPKQLFLVNPFLLSPKSYGNIDLTTFLANTPDFGNVSASGLVADGTSAAIALFQTTTHSDVTVTTNNGTSLLPYDPAFLTKPPPPQGGSTTLTIPAANLIAIGSVFYAAALVQAPAAGVSPSFAQPVVVTAQQTGGPKSKAIMSIVPPPVLLVHGLWGDAGSLSFYQTTLAGQAPWSNPNFVFELTYPGDESFASADSLDAMKTEASMIIQQVQSQGIVGARMDVVAHSMGGLLLRGYSKGSVSGPCDKIVRAANTAPYRSFSNRCQGQFHTIVTLDTPEDGSKLAPTLWNNRTKGIANWALLSDDLLAFWLLTCGSIHNDLIACMNNSGASITGGAIEALIPGSGALSNLPPPNIPGASWKAIASINTIGLERFGVQELIDAINRTPTGIPTIDSILGVPNDDIVPVASQLSGSPPVQWTESGFGHADIFGITEAVTNSPEAAAQSMCWLAGAGCTASPAKPVAYDPILNMPMNARVENCATVEQPTAGQINVGEPFTLHIHGVGLGTLALTQRQIHGDGYHVEDKFRLGEPSWNGADLRVTPRVLGNVRLNLVAACADGGYAFKGVDIVVGVDPGKVTSMRADRSFHELHMPDSSSAFYLTPEITVKGLTEPVELGSLASYRIVSASTNPPVTIDNAGKVKSVHPGTATIEISFEGRTVELPVLVK